MIFRPFYHFESGCAGYVFGCGTAGKCAAVDIRAEDVDVASAFAASKNMRITHVIDTHVHADHRSGGPVLARQTGAAYCLHESAVVTGLRRALVKELEMDRRQVAFMGYWRRGVAMKS